VKKHVILQKTLPNQSFVNLERVGPGEKGCHLLATARKGFGRYLREAFSGLVHKLDPVPLPTREKKKKEREKEREREPLRAEDARPLPRHTM